MFDFLRPNDAIGNGRQFDPVRQHYSSCRDRRLFSVRGRIGAAHDNQLLNV
jgi:hypothetical protein